MKYMADHNMLCTPYSLQKGVTEILERQIQIFLTAAEVWIKDR